MISNYTEFILENVLIPIDLAIDMIEHVKDSRPDLIQKVINNVDNTGKSLLMAVVQKNKMDLIDYILKFKPDIQHKDKKGQNVLYYCRNISMVRKFYDLGVDPLAENNKTYKNILHHLSSRKLFNADLYQLLINDGVSINKTDKYNQNVLTYSIMNKTIVKLLIENGAELNDKNIQEKIFDELAGGLRYYKNKKKLVIDIFKLLFDNGMVIQSKSDFSGTFNDIDMYGKGADLVDDVIKPLKKYFSEDFLIFLFNDCTNGSIRDELFANKLLMVDDYPKLFQRAKKYFGDRYKEKLKPYLDKHPYMDEVGKYNL